jgi:hypothetical protein
VGALQVKQDQLVTRPPEVHPLHQEEQDGHIKQTHIEQLMNTTATAIAIAIATIIQQQLVRTKMCQRQEMTAILQLCCGPAAAAATRQEARAAAGPEGRKAPALPPALPQQ